MSALSTQSGTLSTVPTSTQIAADQVGTANAPASGDRIQYVKLDIGAAGASSPITAANALPVSGTVTAARPTTGTRTSVSAAAADTSLLAANTARFGAAVWNDADKVMYLALGSAAASTTDYTAQVAAGGYYETPFGYTGAVRAIWASSPTGSARVTELS